jgi:hypothetical protein
MSPYCVRLVIIYMSPYFVRLAIICVALLRSSDHNTRA